MTVMMIESQDKSLQRKEKMKILKTISENSLMKIMTENQIDWKTDESLRMTITMGSQIRKNQVKWLIWTMMESQIERNQLNEW